MEYKPTQSEIEQVKNINGWAGEEHEGYLNTMLPLLVEHVTAHCNNLFGLNQTPAAKLPGGVMIFLAKACEHNKLKAGIKSRTMGSVSYSYDLDFPEAMYKYLRPYKKVKFHASR